MPDPNDLTGILQTQAINPSSATGDMGSVTERPLADLINLDRYLASKAAVQRRSRGLRFNRLRPSGLYSAKRFPDDHFPSG